MKKEQLFKNQNFEFVGELSTDQKAYLIAQSDLLTLNEKIEQLNQIKNECSECVKEGIEQYAEKMEISILKIKEMLENGYVLFPVLEKDESFVYPQVLTSIEQFLSIGSNHHYILIKIGEESLNNTAGYGFVRKNDDNELMSAGVSKKLLPSELFKTPNCLFAQNITIEHKFKRFDIIRVPYHWGYEIVVNKEDIDGKVEETNCKSPFITDLYTCRPITGWDFGESPYFNHATSIIPTGGFYEKVEYDDAPSHVRKLVDYLMAAEKCHSLNLK